jgi:hypothetical protein
MDKVTFSKILTIGNNDTMSERVLEEQTVPEAGSAVPVPCVTRQRFSELTGLPLGVVIGLANKGYLGAPVRLGKYALVNLELLRKQCLEREFR